MILDIDGAAGPYAQLRRDVQEEVIRKSGNRGCRVYIARRYDDGEYELRVLASCPRSESKTVDHWFSVDVGVVKDQPAWAIADMAFDGLIPMPAVGIICHDADASN